MAKNKTVLTGKVEVMIPRAPAGDDQNMFVSVNGKSYLLPRGKKSWVPPEVAVEIQRATDAQEAYDTKVDELKQKSNV